MVKTDRRNYTGTRFFYCCCRIQSSTKACFKYHIIHICIRKNHHSHQKQELKICWMITTFRYQLICKFFYLFKCSEECIIVNILLIDLKAFIDHNQMRRGKQSTGISGFSKDRSQKCTGASLSICSCHMYNLKLLLRISKTPQAFFCVLQFILCCKFRSFFNISNRFFVIHKKIHHSSNVFAAIWSLKPNRYDIIIYEW